MMFGILFDGFIFNGRVWKVKTQEAEIFFEEVKSLVTAWCIFYIMEQSSAGYGLLFSFSFGDQESVAFSFYPFISCRPSINHLLFYGLLFLG